MASNQPYIPLYIGDWERDTNCISPLAEFALLKLTFKLFNAEKRGVFYTNFRTLSLLFKSTLDETKDIFNELIENKVLDIEEIESGKFCIKSRRMIREATISEIRAAAGEKGGIKTQAKVKQNQSKRQAKSKQNTDIDIEYIITFLNKNSNRDFKFNSKKTIDVISARKKEGYERSDFEKVIMFKCDQWLNDEKMSQYLQPETLFGNKFEGYLQASRSVIILGEKTKDQEPSDEVLKMRLELMGQDRKPKLHTR